jgi:hypothetical protein
VRLRDRQWNRRCVVSAREGREESTQGEGGIKKETRK